MCLLRGTDWIFIYNSTFCPHSVFVCFVWIWEQTAIISLYSINWLVFITECVFTARYGLGLFKTHYVGKVDTPNAALFLQLQTALFVVRKKPAMTKWRFYWICAMTSQLSICRVAYCPGETKTAVTSRLCLLLYSHSARVAGMQPG